MSSFALISLVVILTVLMLLSHSVDSHLPFFEPERIRSSNFAVPGDANPSWAVGNADEDFSVNRFTKHFLHLLFRAYSLTFSLCSV